MSEELSDQEIFNLHEIGRKIMEYMGHENFIPTLVVIPPDDEKAMIATIPLEAGRSYAMVQRVILSMPFIPVSIALTCDTYMAKAGMATEEEVLQELDKPHVPLAHRFAQGDPDVTEALNTIVLSPGKSATVVQSYKWTPVDGWEWDEPEVNVGNDWDYERIVTGKPRLDHRGRPICPICNGFIPNNAHPGEYIGALSHVDNKTEICSECGTREGLANLDKFLK